MVDRIGIIAPYCEDETTAMAVQLAEHFQSCGSRVSFFAVSSTVHTMYPAWDHRVFRLGQCLESNLKQQDTLIWMNVIHGSDISLSYKHGVFNVAVLTSENVNEEMIPILAGLDSCVTLFKSTSKGIASLSHHKISTTCIPWTLPLPTLKPKVYEKGATFKVCVPMCETQPARVSTNLFGMLEAVLVKVPNSQITLLMGPGWNRVAKKAIRWLETSYPDRILRVKATIPEVRHRALAECHLMLWPSLYENTALMGLWARTAGVPTVAWDVRPINEMLGVSSAFLVKPCKTIKSDLLSVVEGNYTNMQDMVLQLSQEPDTVNAVANTTTIGLSDRKIGFTEGWNSLWS